MAKTTTSQGTGKWSAIAWSAGLPSDGDTVIIDTYKVEYDEDMSLWSSGVSITIQNGGELTCCTDANDYYLKCGGILRGSNSGVNSLTAGTEAVPLPANVTWTIEFIGSNYISGDTGSNHHITIGLFCTEPTYRYVSLDGAHSASDSSLTIDTDLSIETDYWQPGDDILVINNKTSPSPPEVEEHTISSISGGTTINLSGSLSLDKFDDSLVVVRNRNIKIIGGTSTYVFYRLNNGYTHYVSAQIDASTTSSRVFYANTKLVIGGAVYATGDGSQLTSSCYPLTITGCLLSNGLADYMGSSCYTVWLKSTGVVSGSTYAGFYRSTYAKIDGLMFSNRYHFMSSSVWLNAPIKSGYMAACYCGYVELSPLVVVDQMNYGFYFCGKTYNLCGSGFNTTTDYYWVGMGGEHYAKGISTPTINMINYADGLSAQSNNLLIDDLNGVEGYVKCYCASGIIETYTSSNVAGGPFEDCLRWVFSNDTYYTYIQREYELQPGEYAEFSAWVCQSTTSMTDRFKMCIFEFGSDPFIDESLSYIEEAQIVNTTGKQKIVIKYQPEDKHTKIIMRLMAKSTSSKYVYANYDVKIIKEGNQWNASKLQ